MSFKTFNCVSTGAGLSPIPPEGWSVQGDALIVSNATTLAGYTECDPELSGFWGADNVSPGMTYDDFNTLWPVLLSVVVAGVIWKLMRKAFF